MPTVALAVPLIVNLVVASDGVRRIPATREDLMLASLAAAQPAACPGYLAAIFACRRALPNPALGRVSSLAGWLTLPINCLVCIIVAFDLPPACSSFLALPVLVSCFPFLVSWLLIRVLLRPAEGWLPSPPTGRCPACGYPLGPSCSARCPECGMPAPPA